MTRTAVLTTLTLAAALPAVAQLQPRTFDYHDNDQVIIHCREDAVCAIKLPTAETIIQAAGNREFWTMDSLGSFAFVHPLTKGHNTNLHLVTDKNNMYSFILRNVTGTDTQADLSTTIVPVDTRMVAASNGPGEWIRAGQVQQLQQQLQAARANTEAAVDAKMARVPMEQVFDYKYSAEDAKRFSIDSMYHTDRATFIKTHATELFSVYELKDGKPNVINVNPQPDTPDGVGGVTYVIPTVIEKGYLQRGKEKMKFGQKG